jgi:hypothetical protein
MHRHARIALGVALFAASPLVFAQQETPERWTCVANGKDLDIRIANGEATIAVDGERRVLKKQDVRSGTLYTDGTVALRHKGTSLAGEAQWIENGQPSALSRCLPVTG